MPTILTTRANEKSTYVITSAFTDEKGAAVVPTAITWTLASRSGTIINGRTQVAVAAPASSIDIVLSGLDLALQTGEEIQAVRILTVEATYASSLGEGLPLKDQCSFTVDDLKSVT